MRRNLKASAAVAALCALAPQAALACACGCSVFDVGTSTLLPAGPGGTAFLEYDYLDQSHNWSGSSSAPAGDNDDKRIRSNFFLAGMQYMFDDEWGAMVEVPYTTRSLHTEEPGEEGTFDHSSLGDIRLMGMYTGFSPDMSTGIVFGVKLPTGDHDFEHFSRDVQIGSGSTDALLGAYHTGAFAIGSDWSYFGQILWQQPVATQDHYRPGYELNAAAGVSFAGWKIGNAALSPIAQLILSNRGRDSGIEGEPDDTGYTRVMASPGLALQVDRWKLYADVEVPVYQHVNGNQLVPRAAFKLVASIGF